MSSESIPVRAGSGQAGSGPNFGVLPYESSLTMPSGVKDFERKEEVKEQKDGYSG